MPETTQGEGSRAISVVLFVGRDGFDRYGAIVRHLSVGLIDQPVQLRVASSDQRVEALQLGPVQPILFQQIRRPWVRRRSAELIEALANPVATVVHALSADVYSAATIAAEAFDAELLLQVSAQSDCDAVQSLAPRRDARFVAASEPLTAILEQQCRVSSDKIDLVRPGILAKKHIACFCEPDRTPALLCTSALEKGNGIEQLLSAITVLQARGSARDGVLAFLLGRGRLESSLRRLVRELGLSACVTFAHPTGDAVAAMQSADIFILPAAADAFAADSLQAMGAGMAVVAAADSVCDHFHHGETVMVCETSSAAGIADAVGQLLDDRDFAQRIAEGGLAHVRSHHTMSAMAEGVADIYRKLAMKRATFSIE